MSEGSESNYIPPVEQEERSRIPVLRQHHLLEHPVPSEVLSRYPEAVLDTQREILRYLDSQPAEYTAQLKELKQQIPEGMHEQTKIVACIPVAGTQESKNIFNTIESFNNQNADKNMFEVILLVNIPERFIESKRTEFDETVAEIERAQKEFPDLKVRKVIVGLPDDQVRIGNIRKIATDLALIRRHEAGITSDTLLLSNDADNEGLAPEYLSQFVRYAEENPDKDGAVGNLQYDPQSYVRFPTIAVGTEFSTLLDQRGFKNGNVDLFGNNSMMKSSIYASIGGYPSVLRTGEQEWTGDTIRELRKSKGTLGFVDQALLVTSGRRLVISHLQDRKEQIGFGDEKAEEAMRALDIEALPFFDYSNPQATTQMIGEIQETINDLVSTYESGDRLGKNSWFYRDHLDALGITTQVVGEPNDSSSFIQITDLSRFVERQKRMQQVLNSGEKNMAKVFQAAPYFREV